MSSGSTADSTLLHCSWCAHRLSEDGGMWFHCEEQGAHPARIEVDCQGATAWPLHPELERGVRDPDPSATSR